MWRTWEAHIAELHRLRKVAAKVVGHWTHRLIAQTIKKWHHEIVRKRKALKAAGMWLHGALSRYATERVTRLPPQT